MVHVSNLFIRQDFSSFQSDLLEEELIIVNIISLIHLSSYIMIYVSKDAVFVTHVFRLYVHQKRIRKGKEGDPAL